MSAGLGNDHNSIYYFAGIDKARFKRPVVPGDTLRLELLMGRASRGLAKFTGTAHVGDVLAAEAEMMCVLRPIPVGDKA
jgi:3-hydroxyacyl-[acyl-carrier-protein] dehydratase